MAVFSASRLSFIKLLELTTSKRVIIAFVILDDTFSSVGRAAFLVILPRKKPLLHLGTRKLLTITCVGLHYHSFEHKDTYGSMVTTGTFCGYLIILIGVYAGYLFSMPISKRIDIFYSIAGCALFIASGALAIEQFQNRYKSEIKDIGLAKGSLAIINGLAFLIDAFLSFRSE